jgi:hypothetical protein
MELRRVLRLVALFFVTVLCYSIAGCSTKPADMRGKIVASVGEEKIAVRDVRELFGVRAAAHKVFGVPKETKRDALDRLIAGKLLSEESRKRGYYTSEEFKKRYEEGEKDLYIAALFKEKVDRVVRVGDEEIRAETQKLTKDGATLSEEEAMKRATQMLYQNMFREKDNALVSQVKDSMKTEMKSENISRVTSGGEVPDDTTLAEVNGTPVKYGEVKKALANIGGHGMENLEKDPRAINAIIERISISQGLFDYAKKEQVDKGEIFQSVKGNFVSSILIDLLIDNDIKKDVNVTDDEVKKSYDENPAMFEKGAKVSARHILVDSKETADDIYKKIVEGADFPEMAKQFSKDPSAAKGGDLGSFGRGVMVKPFEDAVFSMKKGEVSKPVKTQYGYHIIQVVEKHKGQIVPFEQTKEQLKQYLMDKKMNAELDSLIGTLKEKAKITINEANLDLV